MNHTQRVLASEKRQRFFGHIRATYQLSTIDLIHVIQAADRYSARLRAAALRNLVYSAPVEVTQGRCYLERRRLVRAHFGV